MNKDVFSLLRRIFWHRSVSMSPDVSLPPQRIAISLLTLDIIYLSLSMLIAFSLAGDYTYTGFVDRTLIIPLLVTLLVSAVIFIRIGLYRAMIRFMGQHAIWTILVSITYSSIVLTMAIYVSGNKISTLLSMTYWIFAVLSIGGTRLCVRAFFHSLKWLNSKNVIIYGAGESGRQLLTALQHGENFRVIAFVDDEVSLHGSVINGVPVVPPKSISSISTEFNISQVLLALPTISSERRREIINSLAGLTVSVKTVPKISELVSGRAIVGQIQDIDLSDLLGREPVPPNPELIEKCIASKVVLVTGAGGSIGAELCRQILQSSPRVLIMLDNSEFALYNIQNQIKSEIKSNSTELICLLGSAQDFNRMKKIYSTFDVQTVYHAAAYKHVPIVEYNVAEGVANNVFGTAASAQAARESNVETFVLISTDKAVRPANVMGASKRFAELVVQGLALEEWKTRFCIVRFGNVLGSSGSVVPLFKKQIQEGGPVTVTHPDVSRYFMSLEEAAQLVLQASAMGTGGDVFVLDMGEPVRILELAKRMIQLSGYGANRSNEIVDNIDIEFIGLRPGEKLHEELLLGTRVAGTGHPMIMRAEEEALAYTIVEQALQSLESHCLKADCAGISAVLQNTVDGYANHEIRHDHIWLKQSNIERYLPKNQASDEKIKPFPKRILRDKPGT